MQEIKSHLFSIKMKQVFLKLTILLATLLFFPFSLTQARELSVTEKKVDLKSYGTIPAPNRRAYNCRGPYIRSCERRSPSPPVKPPPTYVKPTPKYVKPPPPYVKPPCGVYKRNCPPEGH